MIDNIIVTMIDNTINNIIDNTINNTIDKELVELEYIIVFTIFFLPICKKITLLLPYNNYYKNYIIVSLSQYTNWNLFLILIYYTTNLNNSIFIEFISINSFVINTVYHIFYIYDRKKIMTLPNIPYYVKSYHIFILSCIVHILPFLIFTRKALQNNIVKKNIFSNIGFLSALFNIIWSYQCFGSFDPTSVYLKVSKKYIIITWVGSILLHISFGYIINTNRLL